MPLVAGLLGQRSACLLVTLLVVHSLKVAMSTLEESVDAPPLAVGAVAVIANSTHPLLAIVTCSNGQLNATVSEVFEISGELLQVHFEESSNKPDQFFVLPNSTGAVYPEGEYEILMFCHNPSLVETATIPVSILSIEDPTVRDQPYFTDSSRYVNVSSNTLPGTVIVKYRAKFGQQPTTQRYVVHEGFRGTPFRLDSSSGELSVSESLQKEGTLSMYDIVIVADQGQNEAWTVTTIVIETAPTGSGISRQASKIILTIVALLSVWAGYILP